jgi:hypothetical protein
MRVPDQGQLSAHMSQTRTWEGSGIVSRGERSTLDILQYLHGPDDYPFAGLLGLL